MRTVKSVCALAALGIGMAAAPAVSRADTFVLTTAGCAVCSVNPVGQIVTNTVAGTTTVTATLFGTYFFFQAGNPPEIAFNLSGSPSVNYVTLPGTFSDSGAQGPLGATGNFNESIGTTAHNVTLGQTLAFSFTGLTSFVANAAGFVFAVDLCTNGTNGSCSQGATGFAGAVPGTVATPIPPAALLFGSALLGLGILGRRRRKNGLAAAA